MLSVVLWILLLQSEVHTQKDTAWVCILLYSAYVDIIKQCYVFFEKECMNGIPLFLNRNSVMKWINTYKILTHTYYVQYFKNLCYERDTIKKHLVTQEKLSTLQCFHRNGRLSYLRKCPKFNLFNSFTKPAETEVYLEEHQGAAEQARHDFLFFCFYNSFNSFNDSKLCCVVQVLDFVLLQYLVLFICLVFECLGVWMHVFGLASTELTQFFIHSLGPLVFAC